MNGERILVVDDAEIVTEAFAKELSPEGYNVDKALSGKEAVSKVKENAYDVIFVDLVMPEMDGIETCKKIKELRPETTLVFMTGHVNKDTIYKEIEFTKSGGMNFYLYKPFLEGEILEITRKALSKDN